MAKKPKETAPPPARKIAEDEPDERPTVIPKFDPAALARETAAGSKRPSRAPTPAPKMSRDGKRDVHNERTISTKAPPPPESLAPETTQMPESMRTSLLSMADARVPSIKPMAQRVPTLGGFAVSALDRGWEDFSTDEPAKKQAKGTDSDGPNRRATNRLRAPSAETMAALRDDGAGPSSEFADDDANDARAREHPLVTPAHPPPPPPHAPHQAEGAGASPSEHPVSSRSVPREEPKRARVDTPEATIFSPARAAAALTSPSNRPKPLSEAPIAMTPSAATPADTLREMRDRFSLGDYTGALVLADGLLDDDPNNPEVKECAENCRQVLRQMYTARIGPLDRVPVVTVARDQLRWLSIDHRAGFVLSHIDGVSSLEMILDVSGMPLLDALRILCELSQQRIISFR